MFAFDLGIWIGGMFIWIAMMLGLMGIGAGIAEVIVLLDRWLY